MALPTSLGQRALQSLNRPSALQFIGTPQMGAPATQPVPQNIMGLRQKVLEQQMRPQMTPAQQFAQMTAGLPAMERTPAPDMPKGLGGLLSGMIPEAGTPEMAGIGAAGQKLLELSGYRQVPITTAEALGQAAGAFTQARGAALQQQKEEQAAQAAAERQARLDAMAAEKQAQEARLSEARIYEIYNKSPDETTLIQNMKAAGIDPSSDEGKQIIIDYLTKKGGTDVSVTLGDGKQELTPSVKTMVQKDIMSLDATLDNLSMIRSTMKPEYLTGQYKVKSYWNKLLDTWGTLPAEKKKELAEYSQGIQAQAKLLNDYVKMMTGAQMSVAEVPRFAKAIPTAGDWVAGIPSDSPTTFFSKLDQFEYMTSLSRARARYAMQNGLEVVRREPTEAYPEGEFIGIMDKDGGTLTFGKFEKMMASEAKELSKGLMKQDPALTKQLAQKQAAQQVAEKYGISVPSQNYGD